MLWALLVGCNREGARLWRSGTVDFRFLHLTIVTRSVTFRSSRSINQTESLTPGERMNILEREPDERTLIEAAQNQPARFAELYEQNFDRIYAFFARRVSTREEAQDLTAEFFTRPLLPSAASGGKEPRSSLGSMASPRMCFRSIGE